jgi:hypothetical protein
MVIYEAFVKAKFWMSSSASLPRISLWARRDRCVSRPRTLIPANRKLPGARRASGSGAKKAAKSRSGRRHPRGPRTRSRGRDEQRPDLTVVLLPRAQAFHLVDYSQVRGTAFPQSGCGRVADHLDTIARGGGWPLRKGCYSGKSRLMIPRQSVAHCPGRLKTPRAQRRDRSTWEE